MRKNEKPGRAADWSLATWDGSRREALRRWARLPLERVIAALEEMRELSDMLSKSPAGGKATSQPAAESAVHEQPGLPARRAQAGDYTAKAETQPLTSRDATPTGNRGSPQPNKKGGHEK